MLHLRESHDERQRVLAAEGLLRNAKGYCGTQSVKLLRNGQARPKLNVFYQNRTNNEYGILKKRGMCV